MEIIYLKPGEPCPEAECGDFLMIEGNASISKLIMFVQPFSHVVPFKTPYTGGDAQAYGVIERPVSVYEDVPRVLVRIGASQGDREQIRAFLESVLAEKRSYGYLTFACVGLAMLTGWKFTFGIAGTSICSGLTAEALVRAGHIFEKPAPYVTPKDLVDYFEVEA